MQERQKWLSLLLLSKDLMLYSISKERGEKQGNGIASPLGQNADQWSLTGDS